MFVPIQLRCSVVGMVLCIVHAAAPARAQTPAGLDPQRIGALAGTNATQTPDGVVRLAWPRSDIHANVDGTDLPPFAGLTSWAAFQSDPKSEAMVMGDLVLLQDEVNPVMDVLFEHGLSVTALHNHFFYDEPRVYFMHIGGQGTVAQLVPAVRAAMEKVHAIRSAAPQPPRSLGDAPPTGASSITPKPIEEIFKQTADQKDGMLKVTVGRTTKMSCGCTVASAMGVNTWAAFLGTDEHALVDGDFACLPGELQATLRTLRKSGINIVAIHSHMEDESPRVIFLHYWGVGRAVELAQGVKAALDAQKTAVATAEKR